MKLLCAVLRGAWVLLILALLPATALAQKDGPVGQRADADRDVPVDATAGVDPLKWDLVPVAGFEPGATLGRVWAADDGVVFAWASRTVAVTPLHVQTPRRADDATPRLPDGGVPSTFVTSSTLFRLENGVWSVALGTPGEKGVSLFGRSAHDVYAATSVGDFGVRLYHFDGVAWRLERLPPVVSGPVGGINGDSGHLYFRTGDAILQKVGTAWQVAYVDNRLEDGTEVIHLEDGGVAAPSRQGMAVFDGATWAWLAADEACDMRGAWAARDEGGVLHFFATGSDPLCCGATLWQFVEQTPGTLRGSFVPRIAPGPGAVPHTGSGAALWGRGVHEVYGVGTNLGCGCLFRFNGVSWTRIFPVTPMALPTGLGGTAAGDVWVGLIDGRLLHGTPNTTGEGGAGAIMADRAVTAGLAAPRVRWEAGRRAVIRFTLAEGRHAEVSVYNVAGRRVAIVDRSFRGPGAHEVRWGADGVPPGVYFCRVSAGPASAASRLLVAP